MTAKKRPTKKAPSPDSKSATDRHALSLSPEERGLVGRLVETQMLKDNRFRMRVNPTAKVEDRLSLLMGKLLCKELVENGEEYKAIASHLLYHIKNDAPKELAAMFKKILDMKKAHAKGIHRNALVLALWHTLEASSDSRKVSFNDYAVLELKKMKEANPNDIVLQGLHLPAPGK